MNDPIDRRLQDAGRRLRDAAPTAGATDAALDTLDGTTTPSRRVRWIVPSAIVTAAAAAALGIVVVDGPDEALQQVPADAVTTTTAVTVVTTSPAPSTTTADTVMAISPSAAIATTSPSTTPAPTTTTTTPPTTTTTTPPTSAPRTTIAEPSGGATFAGGLPSDASAALLGCPGTLGELAAVSPDPRSLVTGVACAEDYAYVVMSNAIDGALYVLQRVDGQWATIEGPGTATSCDQHLADACRAFGVDEDLYGAELPLPTREVLEDPNSARSVDVTEQIVAFGATAATPEELADLIAGGLVAQSDGDPVLRTEPGVLAEAGVVTVRVQGIPDDAAHSATYVVRYRGGFGDPFTASTSLVFYRCARGVTSDGLCI